MEYRLTVQGEAITDWERVRAADVALWRRSFATSETPALSIDVESRRIPNPDAPTPDLAKLKRPELVALCESRGIEIPGDRMTKRELIAVLREA